MEQLGRKSQEVQEEELSTVSGSGVRKLRASTQSKIMMNFSEISQIVLHNFIIPATLKVPVGVLVSVLSLTLLLFRGLNAVQGLGV